MAGDATYPDTWEPPSAFYNAATKLLVYGIIAFFVLWSFTGIDITLERFLVGVEESVRVMALAWPPDFGARQQNLIWRGMFESVGIALWATGIGVLLSIPFAFLGAKNVAPGPIYYPTRVVFVLSRTFHPLILGILFVKMVGFGALAGIMTFVVGTVGYWSKLLAEDVEDIDEGQVEAIRAVGGSPLQSIIYGVVPQVMPRAIGLTIYRWDSNIRGSVIIGIVGAGGIGLTLLNSYRRYEYDFTLAILLSIIVLVLLGEFVSAYLRRWTN